MKTVAAKIISDMKIISNGGNIMAAAKYGIINNGSNISIVKNARRKISSYRKRNAYGIGVGSGVMTAALSVVSSSVDNVNNVLRNGGGNNVWRVAGNGVAIFNWRRRKKMAWREK